MRSAQGNRVVREVLGFLLLAAGGCAAAPPQSADIPAPQSYEYHLCEDLEFERVQQGKFRGKKHLTQLENETDAFYKGQEHKVFMVMHWFDLVPDARYTFRFEWYRPDGKRMAAQQAEVKVLHNDWYTFNSLKLDWKYNHPSGQWAVKVYANQEHIVTARFLLADNPKEMAELRSMQEGEGPQAVSSEPVRTETPAPALPAGASGDRFAVVVGIAEYEHANRGGLSNLIYADDDARAFADILLRLGWSRSHVNLLVNEQATRRNVLIALESWLTKAGPSDQIVLFWAGHGFPDPADPEKVYFACYDTDVTVPATGYRMDRVRAALEEREAKNVIVLADTCHAGKLITRGRRHVSVVPGIQRMRRERTVPKGWIFMVGADTDRSSIEHTSWKNGAFTHCLLQGLSGKADGHLSVAPRDGIVTMRELKAYLSTVMPEETLKVLGVARHPVILTNSGDPDIWDQELKAD
jgi:hypothetical protein